MFSFLNLGVLLFLFEFHNFLFVVASSFLIFMSRTLKVFFFHIDHYLSIFQLCLDIFKGLYYKPEVCIGENSLYYTIRLRSSQVKMYTIIHYTTACIRSIILYYAFINFVVLRIILYYNVGSGIIILYTYYTIL